MDVLYYIAVTGRKHSLKRNLNIENVMDGRVKSELDNIVRVLAETGTVSKIFLFGSYASGEETPDSDIDLCVLTTEKDRRPIDITVDLRMKLWDVQKMPMDLLTYNHDEFLARAEYSSSFQHHIKEHGVVLYEHR